MPAVVHDLFQTLQTRCVLFRRQDQGFKRLMAKPRPTSKKWPFSMSICMPFDLGRVDACHAHRGVIIQLVERAMPNHCGPVLADALDTRLFIAMQR